MIFENSSLKGIFGQNMSYPPKWSLTDDSRFSQAATLNDLVNVEYCVIRKPYVTILHKPCVRTHKTVLETNGRSLVKCTTGQVGITITLTFGQCSFLFSSGLYFTNLSP